MNGVDQNYQPEIDPTICLRCKKCIEVCPNNVLEWSHGKVVVARPENCTGCGKCIDECPTGAIWLE